MMTIIMVIKTKQNNKLLKKTVKVLIITHPNMCKGIETFIEILYVLK